MAGSVPPSRTASSKINTSRMLSRTIHSHIRVWESAQPISPGIHSLFDNFRALSF
jgi:hypothetical protein